MPAFGKPWFVMKDFEMYYGFPANVQNPPPAQARTPAETWLGVVMWMAHPNQADHPQGSHRVSDGILAANGPGTSSGWQQSKQNWARPAVVGHTEPE